MIQIQHKLSECGPSNLVVLVVRNEHHFRYLPYLMKSSFCQKALNLSSILYLKLKFCIQQLLCNGLFLQIAEHKFVKGVKVHNNNPRKLAQYSCKYFRKDPIPKSRFSSSIHVTTYFQRFQYENSFCANSRIQDLKDNFWRSCSYSYPSCLLILL